MEKNKIANIGILYVVGTPIGNLKDITIRALEILKEVNYIACEDTRVTQKLVAEYNIKTSLISYHQHSKITKINYIIDLLLAGSSVALVSDAGTPGISDPGGKLVEEVFANEIKVVAVPGPSAAITLLSISGLSADKFNFMGFVPHKKGRQTFFKNISKSKNTIVCYESVHRIMKTLKSFSEVLGDNRKVVVGRELTKYFEETRRGTAKEVLEYFEKNPKNVKGEFVVVVGK